MIVATGMTRLHARRYASARTQRSGIHDDWRDLHRRLHAESVLAAPFPRFGQFDEDSRRVTLCVALALQDAGIDCAQDRPRDTGLLVSSVDGAGAANAAYFQDYLAGGRTLGRSRLFIYTLPTSPAAEAAIHFGLTGPIIYVGRSAPDPAAALHDCARLLRGGWAEEMLCIVKDASAIVGVVLKKASSCTERPQAALAEAARLADVALRDGPEERWGFGPGAQSAEAHP